MRVTSARSFLVFPGDHDRKRERALSSGADAVVLDLEDGVAPEAKADARARLRAFAAAPGFPVRLVRVNVPTDAVGAADLDAVAELEDVAVVVPKARLETVEAAARAGRPLIALVEDGAGVRDVYEIAAHPAVLALAIGSADLTASLGLVPTGGGTELLFVRSQLVIASAAAGTGRRSTAPASTCTTRSRSSVRHDWPAGSGSGGSSAFTRARWPASTMPSLQPTRRSRERVASSRPGRRGAVGLVDGMLVDLPVVERARAVLESSERSESG